ncbi:MAG: hypothetical protein RXR43_13325 [Sulfolobus sp.]
MAVIHENQDVAVIKTIRISKKLVSSIEKIAFIENKKFNTIVNEELSKFINYTYKIRKISGSEIIISSRFFSSFVDLLPDDIEKIKEKFYAFGKNWGKEYLILWNNNDNKSIINFKSFINLLIITSSYSNLFKLDIENRENTYIIILHHNYNIKYSAALVGYYLGILEWVKKCIDDIHFDIADNSIIFTINLKQG